MRRHQLRPYASKATKKKHTPDLSANLIAPCEMNSGICSAYLAYSHGIERKRGKISHCIGCRSRNKQYAYLKGQCKLLSKNKIGYCYQCPDFPCLHLKNIDHRYQTRYGRSFIANLEYIRDFGIDKFLKNQKRRFLCPNCKEDLLCVHNAKCYSCEKIKSWRG